MTFRPTTLEDYALLAELNHQLIRDEGHRNAMTVAELEQQMRGWLSGEYRAMVFEVDGLSPMPCCESSRRKFTFGNFSSFATGAGSGLGGVRWRCCAPRSGRRPSG
jgi:hypothetical protein